jgi:hypothetical protein
LRVSAERFNPILGYKLDPGEPGLAYSAPASMSVLRVLTQELSNYIAFKKEAMEKGGFIIGGGIYLDLRKRGGFLAAVAGKTKVWMYVPEVKNTGRDDFQSISGKDNDENVKDQIKKMKEDIEMKLQTTTDPVERERLEKELALLDMALNSFKASLSLPEFLIGVLLDTFA